MTPVPLVTLIEVTAIFRVGRTKLRDMRMDPAFPKPVSVSERPLKWRASDLQRYLETL